MPIHKSGLVGFAVRLNPWAVIALAAAFLLLPSSGRAVQQLSGSMPPPQTDANCSDLTSTNFDACVEPQSDKARPAVQSPQHFLSPANGSNLRTEAKPRKTAPFRPEPLTDFQKFAATATGEILPVYGSELFRNVPSTFAPLDQTPVPANYVIGPGDELRIRVWGQINFESNLPVNRSGDIYIPRVGSIHVAGAPFADLQQRLHESIAQTFRNFDLTVDVGQIRAIQIYVTGQAARPGVYTISSFSTLVDALFASGGPSPHGSLRTIQLKRNGSIVTKFDLYELLTQGDKGKDASLMNGDVVFIPPVGPQVALTGSVRNRSIYELKVGDTISDLLNAAGGASTVAAETHLTISRIDQHRALKTIRVAFDSAGLATPLSDGDLVHLESVIPQLNETVTLRGNLANPGRFPWRPGMRLSELIPDKESLLTRDYWWKRAQLGYASPEFKALDDLQTTTQFQQQLETNHPIHVQRDNGPELNLEETQPQRGPSEQGASIAATQRQTVIDKRQPLQIRFLAPEIDWDYASIERIDPNTLKMQVIPFDLGGLVLKRDSSQDLELQPGDIVTIFSEADIRLPIEQQSKLVKLDGEFVHAGTYTVKPGETLRQLVQRAGGFTRNAYLYASELTRESTRRIQQARLDEYARTLEMQVQRSTVALASSPVNSAQDMASATAAQTGAQALVNQLRQVRASGRLILEFKPDAADIASIPDIALENGDVFVVPSKPYNVNVLGAVKNQSSFLFAAQGRVRTYLKLAGGPTRSADVRQEFIIRANGAVIGRDSSFAWQSFENQRLNPGDTVIVPEKTFKQSAIRGFLDWSQVFSQLALGSAAINVLR